MKWLKSIRDGLRNARKASELAQDVQKQWELSEDLAKHVNALREEVKALQTDSAQMLTEWATTLDKIGRWAARQSARERRDTNARLDTLGATPEGNGHPTEATPRSMSKPELRVLAARMRGAPSVPSHEGG